MRSNVVKYFRVIALFLFVLIVFFSFPSLCNGHDHSHDPSHVHHHHHGPGHEHHHHEESRSYMYSREANSPRPRKQMSISRLWIEALSSTLIISIAPFLILFFVPLNHKRDHESLLKILLSFASGGLLGDAFLHLIPHALAPHAPGMPHVHDHNHGHDHGHSHADGNVGAWVLCGILVFLIVEKCVRLMKGEHAHLHSHGELPAPEEKDDGKKEDEKELLEKKEDEKDQEKDAAEDNTDAMSESDDEIKVAGYLNLAADFTHNFTDGLAIGASYLAGDTVGLVTTVTILFHEIPHEIGDFAILVQSGCSKKKAMLLQLITAFGALSGTVVSLISGGIDASTTSWVLPFTAGGFIYISTVSIIPELLTDSSFAQSVKEIFALLAGVLMMVIVAQFE